MLSERASKLPSKFFLVLSSLLAPFWCHLGGRGRPDGRGQISSSNRKRWFILLESIPVQTTTVPRNVWRSLWGRGVSLRAPAGPNGPPYWARKGLSWVSKFCATSTVRNSVGRNCALDLSQKRLWYLEYSGENLYHSLGKNEGPRRGSQKVDAIPEMLFWEEEGCLAHCSVGQITPLPLYIQGFSGEARN